MSVRFDNFAGTLLLCLLIVGCNEETRRCQSLMTTAQGVVNNVDGKQQSSVEQSLSAVQAALDACDKAGRTTERDELTKAKNELKAHLDYMKKKAAEPPTPKLTPEQAAALVKSGDPACPKGQAYKRGTQEIRCTGPQIADMNWPSADAYFTNRGYKLTPSASPPTLKAEYGSELVVFTFSAVNDAEPAKCITYYPPMGMSWQEATGRITGTAMRKLDNVKTVKTARGEVPLRIDQSETKLIVYVGTC